MSKKVNLILLRILINHKVRGSYLTYKYLFNYNSFLVPTC